MQRAGADVGEEEGEGVGEGEARSGGRGHRAQGTGHRRMAASPTQKSAWSCRVRPGPMMSSHSCRRQREQSPVGLGCCKRPMTRRRLLPSSPPHPPPPPPPSSILRGGAWVRVAVGACRSGWVAHLRQLERRVAGDVRELLRDRPADEEDSEVVKLVPAPGTSSTSTLDSSSWAGAQPKRWHAGQSGQV